jgi:hypothetical protein
MKIKFIIWQTIIFLLLGMAIKEVKANVPITEDLTLGGFVRYEFGIHTGKANPNLSSDYDLQLSRFFLNTEWTYKPSDHFKLFANIRLTEDTTSLWDGRLGNYNAFPVDVPRYKDLMLRMGHTDHFRAEVWELYSDISLGDLWLRLGKQQIAWGEMIGARILDCINPLDMSWNMNFEPEEFELIRIPEWTIRGTYNLSSLCLPSWITTPSLEAFLIPGDVQPNVYAEPNAPFYLGGFPSYIHTPEENNRGKLEYGVRLGAGAAGFYGTLNYLHLFAQDMNMRFKGFVPDPVNGIPFFAPGDMTPYAMVMQKKYPSTDNVGASLNYAFADPYNLVCTFEGLYIINQPYGNANPANGFAAVKNQGTFKWAFRLDHNHWVWPVKFLAPSMAGFTLEFVQTAVQGNNHDILGPANVRVDKTQQMVVFQTSQPLLHGDLTPTLQFIYDTRDAHLWKPSIKYVLGDHWYFDVYGVIIGGEEKRTGALGGLNYTNGWWGRITFQF